MPPKVPPPAPPPPAAPQCHVYLEEILLERSQRSLPDPPPRLFTDEEGMCAVCDLPPGQHPRRPPQPQAPPPHPDPVAPPALAPVAPDAGYDLLGPSLDDYLNYFLPDGAPCPLVSRDVPETACLVVALHTRAHEEGSTTATRALWGRVHDATVRALPLVFDRCVSRAPPSASAPGRLTSIKFVYSDIPDGRSEPEVARFHHSRGKDLVMALQARVAWQASRAVGPWRDVMDTSASPITTAAENITQRIISVATTLATDVPIAMLRPTSPRSPAWWSAVWARLLPQDRLAVFFDLGLTVLAALAQLDLKFGRYITRQQWLARYAPSGGLSKQASRDRSKDSGGGDDRVADAGSPKSSAKSTPRGGNGGRGGGRFGNRGRGGRNDRRSRGDRDGKVIDRSASPVVRVGGNAFVSSLRVSPQPCAASPTAARTPASSPSAVVSEVSAPLPSDLEVPPLSRGNYASGCRAASPTGDFYANGRCAVPPTAGAVSDAPTEMWGGGTQPPPSWLVQGAAVPDSEDWLYTRLPGAEDLAELISRGPRGSVARLPDGGLSPGVSLQVWRRLLEGLRPVESAAGRLCVDRMLPHIDEHGLLSVAPSAFGSFPFVVSPQDVSPTVEDILAKGAALTLGGATTRPTAVWPEGRLEGPDSPWFHRLFTVPKSDGGVRGISDLRWVNKCFPPPPSFAHPAVLSAFQGRFAVRLDLTSAFYQPRVARALSHKFAFATPAGGAFRYVGLPMGWSWSPYLFDGLLAPFDALARALRLRVVRYADDILVLADSPGQLARDLRLVIDLLHAAGWQLALKKSYLVAASRVVFLGVAVDLATRTVRWARHKKAKTLAEISLLRAHNSASIRDLQRVAGRLIFLTSATPVFRAFARPMFDALREWEALDASPDVLHTVSAPLRACFSFWSSTAASSLTDRWWPVGLGPRWHTRTDASDVAVGWEAVSAPDGSRLSAGTIPLGPGCTGKASAVRETTALVRLLEFLGSPDRAGPPLREGDTLAVGLDAQVVVSSSTKGTARAPQLVAEFASLALLLLSLPPIALRTYWLPRSGNTEADARSRLISAADSRLADSVYQYLLHWWGAEPLLDLFASAGNTRAPVFYAAHPSSAAAGVDGLSAPVTPLAYAFPPFALANLTAAMLIRYRAAGVPVLAVLPADACLRMLGSWPDADRLPLPSLCISPPPYTSVCPSPRPLMAIRVSPPPPPPQTTR